MPDGTMPGAAPITPETEGQMDQGPMPPEPGAAASEAQGPAAAGPAAGGNLPGAEASEPVSNAGADGQPPVTGSAAPEMPGDAAAGTPSAEVPVGVGEPETIPEVPSIAAKPPASEEGAGGTLGEVAARDTAVPKEPDKIEAGMNMAPEASDATGGQAAPTETAPPPSVERTTPDGAPQAAGGSLPTKVESGGRVDDMPEVSDQATGTETQPKPEVDPAVIGRIETSLGQAEEAVRKAQGDLAQLRQSPEAQQGVDRAA